MDPLHFRVPQGVLRPYSRDQANNRSIPTIQVTVLQVTLGSIGIIGTFVVSCIQDPHCCSPDLRVTNPATPALTPYSSQYEWSPRPGDPQLERSDIRSVLLSCGQHRDSCNSIPNLQTTVLHVTL